MLMSRTAYRFRSENEILEVSPVGLGPRYRRALVTLTCRSVQGADCTTNPLNSLSMGTDGSTSSRSDGSDGSTGISRGGLLLAAGGEDELPPVPPLSSVPVPFELALGLGSVDT